MNISDRFLSAKNSKKNSEKRNYKDDWKITENNGWEWKIYIFNNIIIIFKIRKYFNVSKELCSQVEVNMEKLTENHATITIKYSMHIHRLFGYP